MHNDGIAAFTGGAGMTAPLWLQNVDPLFQALISIVGFVVLVLTAWNKWLEIRTKRAKLQQMEGGDHGETQSD